MGILKNETDDRRSLLFRAVVEEGPHAQNEIDHDSLVAVLFDIEKAQPSIPHDLCFAYLRRLGVPEKSWRGSAGCIR